MIIYTHNKYSDRWILLNSLCSDFCWGVVRVHFYAGFKMIFLRNESPFAQHSRHTRTTAHKQHVCWRGPGLLIRKKIWSAGYEGENKNNYNKDCALMTPWGPSLFHDSIWDSRGREGAAVTSALSCQLTFYFDLVGEKRREKLPSQGSQTRPSYCLCFRSLGVALGAYRGQTGWGVGILALSLWSLSYTWV